jgi:hypothetical protein
MCFVFMYEIHGTMKPVEIALRREKGDEGA